MVIDKHRHPGLIRRAGTGLITALTATALLSGCAAGQHAATVEETPTADGVSADSGTLGIRDAGIAAPESGNYAPGKDAALQLVIVNSGSNEDQLTSVSTPASGSVVLSPTGAQATGSASASSSASGSASASSSASGSGSASSSASAQASSSPIQSTPIPIGAGLSVRIGYGASDPSVNLAALTATLYPAQAVPVTLTFASGAQISVQLPVKLTTGVNKAPTLATTPSESP